MAREALPYFLPMVNRQMKLKKVIIYGVNRASLELAEKLEDQGIGVTIMNLTGKKHNKRQQLSQKPSCFRSASDIDLLKEASIDTADFRGCI